MVRAKTVVEERRQRSSSPTTPKEKLVGKHVFGNIQEPDPAIADDTERLKQLVLEALKIAKMTLVEIKAWSFGGEKGGISVIALVTESHMVVHVWREYRYATVDIYTCGETSDPHAAFDHVVKVLNPKDHQKFFADRSMPVK